MRLMFDWRHIDVLLVFSHAEMKAAAKTRAPKPARRKPASAAVAIKGHAPAFREIIGLIHSARLPLPAKSRTTSATNSNVSPPATQSREPHKEQHKFQEFPGALMFVAGERLGSGPTMSWCWTIWPPTRWLACGGDRGSRWPAGASAAVFAGLQSH